MRFAPHRYADISLEGDLRGRGLRREARTTRSWAFVSRHGRLLPAGDDRSGLFQHARPGHRHRRDIRTGVVKKYLDPTHRHAGLFAALPHGPQTGVLRSCRRPFCSGVFPVPGIFSGWPDAVTLLAFFASLVMCFLLGFFLESALGMIGFWFLEVSSLLFVYMLFSFFFSGHMFPLDMLPAFWGN